MNQNQVLEKLLEKINSLEQDVNKQHEYISDMHKQINSLRDRVEYHERVNTILMDRVRALEQDKQPVRGSGLGFGQTVPMTTSVFSGPASHGQPQSLGPSGPPGVNFGPGISFNGFNQQAPSGGGLFGKQ